MGCHLAMVYLMSNEYKIFGNLSLLVLPLLIRRQFVKRFAGDEEAALGNSHPRSGAPKPIDGTNRAPVVDAAPPPERERERTEEPERKEKSVLQAKLTKLAIQIGYAGKVFERITLLIDY